MLPVASSTNYIPIQSPLINTAIPGSAITHVPYDNVAPSVSNAQVDNNTAGSVPVVVAEEQDTAPPPQTTSDTSPFPAVQSGAQQSQNVGVQAAFLAQLLADDGSPEIRTILVQYEKMLALSNVKYKPSNALKPTEEPASSYESLLQSSSTPKVQLPPPPVATPVVQKTTEPAPAPQTPAPQAKPAAPTPAPQVVQAYAATVSRNDSVTSSVPAELV